MLFSISLNIIFKISEKIKIKSITKVLNTYKSMWYCSCEQEIYIVGREKIDINKAYNEYKLRIEKRIKNGEQIKVKPKNEWQRTIEKDGKKTITAGESGETAQEKATRLGNVRLSKVLSALKGLKTLASSSQYKFSHPQVKYITEKINNASVDVITAFEGKTEDTKEKIELPA